MPAPDTPEAFEVEIQPARLRFIARADESLLASATRAGLPMPSSCRNGTCRACICRLDRGTVRYLIEWPGLSAEEKRDGFILPCVAHPTSRLVIAPPEPGSAPPATPKEDSL
jgi:ferredoxin